MKTLGYRQTRNHKFRQKLLSNPTKAEVIVKKYLDENWKKLGLNKKVMFQKGFLLPFHRIVDFYILKRKIIIEIDGGYHYNKETKELDRVKDVEWRVNKFKTLRIKNEQVYSGEYIKIIKEFVCG